MSYRVHVERDETGSWIATSPDAPGAVTQAKRLDQLRPRLAEAIAVATDQEPDEIAISSISVSLGDEIDGLVERAKEQRQAAEKAQAEASRAVRAAANALLDRHLSLRDAGEVLEISHQRVDQLVKS